MCLAGVEGTDIGVAMLLNRELGLECEGKEFGI